jgi:hypothetical protein
MAGEYAKGTPVEQSKSLTEIKNTLVRFGADRNTFTYAEQGNQVGIQFTVKNRTVRMTMLLPDRESFAKDRYSRRRVETAIDRDWDQACREYWRTLALGVKAKLSMIEKGLSTFEREFLADLLLPSGETIGAVVAADLDEVMRTGQVPSLAPSLPAPKVIAIGGGSR